MANMFHKLAKITYIEQISFYNFWKLCVENHDNKINIVWRYFLPALRQKLFYFQCVK